MKFWDKFHSLSIAMTAKLPFTLQLVKFIPNFTPARAITYTNKILFIVLSCVKASEMSEVILLLEFLTSESSRCTNVTGEEYI